MIAPTCFVITADHWQQVQEGFMVLLALVWLASINLGEWIERIEYQVRRTQRRRRIAAIRAIRSGQAATR